MDLKSGYPYWAVKNGRVPAFPTPERDLRRAVVGGGVSGARLLRALIERRAHPLRALCGFGRLQR